MIPKSSGTLSSGKIAVFIFIGIFLFVLPTSGTIFYEDGSNLTPSVLKVLTNSTYAGEHNRSVVFFYDSDCGACKPVEEYFATYLTKHPKDKIEIVNLSSGKKAEDRLNNLDILFHREWMNVPVVFVGPVGIEGTTDIIDNFESVYSWYNLSGHQR